MRPGENAYLSCKDENVKRQSEVRAPDAADGLEGDLVGGVAVVGPGLAEADVGEADGAPGEQSGQRRQREEPVEHNLALRVKVDVGQQTKDENDAHRVEGTAGAVDVGEDLGGVALLRKGSKGTGATVDSRHSDGKNRHENGNVHEVIESLEAGVLADEDKGRGVHIVGRGSEKVGVTSVDEETDEEETEDVKAAWVVSLISVARDGGCFKDNGVTHSVIRQKTCLIAPGISLTGLRASAAAKPTSSVPLKAKAAVTNTLQKPRKPFWNGPGSTHRRAPQYSL